MLRWLQTGPPDLKNTIEILLRLIFTYFSKYNIFEIFETFETRQ